MDLFSVQLLAVRNGTCLEPIGSNPATAIVTSRTNRSYHPALDLHASGPDFETDCRSLQQDRISFFSQLSRTILLRLRGSGIVSTFTGLPITAAVPFWAVNDETVMGEHRNSHLMNACNAVLVLLAFGLATLSVASLLDLLIGGGG